MKPTIPALEKIETAVVARRPRGAPAITAAAVDLDDLNSPHTMAVLSVPPGATVLDIGCGPGVVAKALAARGCRVSGLEIDPRKAGLARHHCVEVVEGDVESMPLPSVFGGMTFDAVLCLDVLEHLRDPASVLAQVTAVLAPGGSVLISVPNVTHGALRLELLEGKFRYRNSGLLDHGHLRFFDAEAVNEMIRQAGLRAEATLRVIKRLDQTEFDIDVERIPTAVRETLEKDVDALTYQFFVVARPASQRDVKTEGISLLERQQARIDQLSTEIDKTGGYARHLEAELVARDGHLRQLEARSAEVDQLSAEVERAGAYARHLEAELAAKVDQLRRVEARSGEMDQLAAEIEKTDAVAKHLEAELAAKDEDSRRLSVEIGRITVELEHASAYASRIERELAASHTRAGELEVLAGQLGCQVEASGAKAADLEQLAVDLTRITEDQASYVRHLERELRKRTGDIAIRDDEMSVLRVHVEKTERTIADRDAQLQAAGSALAELEGELQQRIGDAALRDTEMSVLRLHIQETARAVADRDAELQSALSALADHQALAAHLSWVVCQPRHRLAKVFADALVRRAPWFHRLLRPLVLALLRRWPPPPLRSDGTHRVSRCHAVPARRRALVWLLSRIPGPRQHRRGHRGRDSWVGDRAELAGRGGRDL